jgi:hypothetical protein
MSLSTCSRASLRLLTSVLLAASIANAVALPHQVLDPRTANALSNELPTTSDVVAAFDAVTSPGSDPDNVFEDAEQSFRNRTGLQVLKDFFARLFGWDDDSTGDADATVTVTVSVAPTPFSNTSSTASEPMVTPPGPNPSSTLDASSETTPAPSSTPEMSILPVGSLTTAINATLPDPAFSTLLPPYPLNSTLVVVGPTATAVPITGMFSTNPIATGAPYSPGNETFNGTSTVTEELTSVILVTATLVPSVGTGLPVSSGGAPPGTILNVTLPVTILPTGTGSSVSTGISDATSTEIPPYGNTTMGAPTGIVGTGTAAPIDTSLPLYPNVTTSTSTTTTTIAATDLPTILPTLNETTPTNDTLLEFPGEIY